MKNGCILADAMGLGKTLQVIGAMCGAFKCGNSILPTQEDFVKFSSCSLWFSSFILAAWQAVLKFITGIVLYNSDDVG